jgi:hypothetical protein
MKKLIFAIIICALPSLTLANTPRNQHTGYFVEGGFGTMAANVLVGSNAGYHSVTGGYGGALSVGKLTTPTFGWELDTILAEVTRTDPDTQQSASVSGNLIGISGRWVIPLGDNVSINPKLGIAHMYLAATVGENNSESMFVPYDGFSLSYAANDNIDVGVGYEGFLAVVVNAGLLSANITYHIPA